jgi:phosphohistidine phosphatase
MKVLLLLRHADSTETMQGQTDHERTLTAKGIQQAAGVAQYMKKKSLLPEKVVASSATRVKQTVEKLFNDIVHQPVTEFIDDLYEGDVQTYLNIVHGAGDYQSLLMSGHNPTISKFASYISKTRVGEVGTANLLVFHFKGSTWNQLAKGQCELMEHFTP